MGKGKTANWVETNAANVGDEMVAALSAGGIDHLFFTSGSEIGFFQESTSKAHIEGHNNPIRLITVPHEHANLNAALGFAAVSGRPAITAAHVDVGTQHYGGAVHTAYRSGLPVIMTSGFPPTAYAGTAKGGRDEGGHLWMQETYDQNGIVRNYTKWDHRLTSQDNPGMMISRAIQVTRSEPCGPVYLNFPKELTLQAVDGARFPSADQLGIPCPSGPDPVAAEDIAERLVKADHPVVVVSKSGRDPDTVPVLVELCELLGISVVESIQRAYMCFPYRHPLFQTQQTLTEADMVLVLEADVPWVPGRTCPPDDAYIAAVGHDPIKLTIPTYEFTADIRVPADPKLAIEAITKAARGIISQEDRDRISERTARLTAASQVYIASIEEEAINASKETPINPIWVSYQIGQLVGENTVILDETLPGPRMREYMPNSRPGSHFSNPGSSGGWSPGAALGAKLAAPEKDVIAVAGDGFYMFGTPAPALWAAAHYNAPYMMVVFTNRSYTTGTSRIASTYGEQGYARQAGFPGGYFDPPIDFAKEAEAAGAYGETVTDPDEVEPALKRGLEQTRAGKPAVISVWLQRLEGDD
ncbi:MAG: thiamine pyrophosphate-requiring protein [Pseudomonadota bacterium]|nr:thiamine pyrophosphate-requiring protein [Pseudomonadota bacterium]